jgi:hypothetical protein
MTTNYIVSKEPTTKPIGEIGNIDIQVSIDVLQIMLLIISATTCYYAFLAKNRIALSPLANVMAKLKPQDFNKDKVVRGIRNAKEKGINIFRVGKTCEPMHSPFIKDIINLATQEGVRLVIVTKRPPEVEESQEWNNINNQLPAEKRGEFEKRVYAIMASSAGDDLDQ